MAIKTIAEKEFKTFQPIKIELSIFIEKEEDLKHLKKEFKNANLEECNIMSGYSNDYLEILSNILQKIEEQL